MKLKNLKSIIEEAIKELELSGNRRIPRGNQTRSGQWTHPHADTAGDVTKHCECKAAGPAGAVGCGMTCEESMEGKSCGELLSVEIGGRPAGEVECICRCN